MPNSYSFLYPQHATSLYYALQADPYYLHMERVCTNKNPREAMRTYMDYSLQEAETYGKVYLPAEATYGASIWSVPLSAEDMQEKKQGKKTFLKENLGEKALEDYLAIGSFMSKQAEALVPPDAWYLSILGIHPDFQNQRLGVGLVQPILDEADQGGIATYLETFSERNPRFYERLGYRKVGDFYEPTVGARYRLMVREVGG
ncbi:MAG: GNAT family N-acetyltransferase [Bacteroidota bacterium]